MRRFLFLACAFLLCLSSSVSAQPPIEVIYLIPSDQRQDEDKLDVLGKMVADVQTFYADEMKRHGFERKTFQYNKNIRVHNGQHTLKEYLSDINHVWFELSRQTWLPESLADIVFMEGTRALPGNAAGSVLPLFFGESQIWGIDPGYFLVWIPVKVEELPELMTPVLAHELGHVFGIVHRNDLLTGEKRTLMQAITPPLKGIEKHAISFEEAKVLDKSVFLSVLAEEESDGIDADVNNDGYVDLYDVMIVRSGMQNSTSYDTDINNDGVTDENDLAIVKVKAMEAIIAASPSKPKFKLATTWGAIKSR
ncbi:hypothetical protein F4141_14860 [Candidatus Poribacteria bacterium]|nr:hypothetical protein [Candidatus Poribacteria bacterium]MYH81968.1 hypothetical protein [Candidatus Poribacteria bacterium]